MYLILLLFIFNDYEYQLDPFITQCNIQYGTGCWEFCPILKVAYEVEDSLKLPNVFSGNLIDATDSSGTVFSGVIWENSARDTSCLVVKHWLGKRLQHHIGYKVYWFCK